jgi:hypothetical protein
LSLAKCSPMIVHLVVVLVHYAQPTKCQLASWATTSQLPKCRGTCDPSLGVLCLEPIIYSFYVVFPSNFNVLTLHPWWLDGNWLGEMIMRTAFSFWNFNDWNLFWMEWNNVFCDLCLFFIPISYKNELESHISKIFGEFIFSCLCANKQNILHVSHCSISLLSFDGNTSIWRLFEHVISLTYEHVLFH